MLDYEGNWSGSFSPVGKARPGIYITSMMSFKTFGTPELWLKHACGLSGKYGDLWMVARNVCHASEVWFKHCTHLTCREWFLLLCLSR